MCYFRLDAAKNKCIGLHAMGFFLRSVLSSSLIYLLIIIAFLQMSGNVSAFSVDRITSGMTLGDISKLYLSEGRKIEFLDGDGASDLFLMNENDLLYLCDGKLYGYAKRLYDVDRASRLIKDAQGKAYVLPDEPGTYRSAGSLHYEHRHIWKSDDGFEGIRVFMEHDFSLDDPMTMLDLNKNLDFSARFGQKNNASGIYEEHFEKLKCRDEKISKSTG